MGKLDKDIITALLLKAHKRVSVTVLETVDSTNTFAKKLVVSEPQLVAANTQTAGRGRQGRSFFSPKDTGVYMTLAIKTPSDTEYITVAAAVAVSRVLARLGAKNVGIKWVNDIFLNGRKICGILCERSEEKVVIGIGLNISTIEFPDEIKKVAGSLALDLDRNAVIANIAAELLGVLDLAPSELIREYKSRLFIFGREIEYIKNGSVCRAVAVDVNEKGNLIVDTGDILSSGEITLKSENFV